MTKQDAPLSLPNLYECFFFFNLLRDQEAPMLSDQLEEAANYIKSLQEKLEEMKERKELLSTETKEINKSMDDDGKTVGLQLPHIEIQELGPALLVLLICRFDDQFVFYKTIRILEEEGVEVVNASFFALGDKAFHTIHSKVISTIFQPQT